MKLEYHKCFSFQIVQNATLRYPQRLTWLKYSATIVNSTSRQLLTDGQIILKAILLCGTKWQRSTSTRPRFRCYNLQAY